MSSIPELDTANDEAIAQALAAMQEQERDLLLETATQQQLPTQRDEHLIVRGRPVGGNNRSTERSNYGSSSQLSSPPNMSLFQSSSPHMCVVPCVIGNGVCVEMMVDTGAQTSVMSLELARQLQLESRIDRRHQGVAAGVGQARIIGKMFGIVCELGHVEFSMDFMVLDVNDKLLLLGLDLMRRYKCVVDLERDVLIFGGSGGVEVPMLPADQQHIAVRNQLGCPLM